MEIGSKIKGKLQYIVWNIIFIAGITEDNVKTKIILYSFYRKLVSGSAKKLINMSGLITCFKLNHL